MQPTVAMTPTGPARTWIAKPEGLEEVLGKHPALVSGAMHGGFGALCGASAGALAGLAFFPAHVGTLAALGGTAVGVSAAAHGWRVGAQVKEQMGQGPEPSTAVDRTLAKVHDVVTTSTGAMWLDAVIGGGVGYALAPKLTWVIAGAVLAALGGVAGLALLAGAHIASDRGWLPS